jgi:signal transduction histidine kinase
LEPPQQTIWIVDDSRMERQATAAILAPAHSVDLLSDGSEVIERINIESPPDLIIVDWVMRDVSGLEVIEFLRLTPRTSEIPIIVLTSSSEADDLTAAFYAGADDFVRKPVNAGELRARVGRLLLRGAARHMYERSAAEKWLSERRRADAAEAGMLEEQRERAENAERAQLAELFMGVLGHDLRTPLSAISLAGALLSRSDLTAESRAKAAGRVLTSVARMSELIGRVLDLTRSRLGGGIALETQWQDLRVVCTDAVEEARAVNAERPIKFDARGDTSIALDTVRFGQVVANLVSNAVQHGDRSAPVDVVLAGEADAVRLEVRNRGAMIPQAVLATMFEPFRRAADRAADALGGLGLGLYISKQIVEAHGGTLTVASSSSETVFTVTLPRKKS